MFMHDLTFIGDLKPCLFKIHNLTTESVIW